MTLPEGAQISTRLDRSHWGNGPWDDEPDRVAWKERGFHCLLKRNDAGAWCGYVAVPPDRPWHGVDSQDISANCHGGLTYSDHCFGDEDEGICHKPDAGEPDAVWWLGFDCMHGRDAAPIGAFGGYGAYRTMQYAMEHVRALLDQALAA